MSLVQIKHTYPCLTAFLMTELWLKQPKMLSCCITAECQTIKMHQPPQTSANKPSLTGIGMSLDQVKYTYPCLTAFIMTKYWLKQPTCCPATLLLSAKQWRCSRYQDTLANKPSMTGVGMSLVQIKHTYPCLTYFFVGTLAEAAKYAVLLHYCWVPNYEDGSTTTKLLQVNLLWLA